MAIDRGRAISGAEWARRQEALRPTRPDDTTVLSDGTKATRESIEALVAADLAARAADDG